MIVFDFGEDNLVAINPATVAHVTLSKVHNSDTMRVNVWFSSGKVQDFNFSNPKAARDMFEALSGWVATKQENALK